MHIKSEMHAMALRFFVQVPHVMNNHHAKDPIQNDSNAM
jgi:hypothetical protein